MRTDKGFTLVELLVVISIISLLSSIVLEALTTARVKAQDARRLSDMHQMQLALDLYYDAFGVYPDSDYQGSNAWDTPGDGTFLAPLVANKFLPANILDPTTNDIYGNYKYFRYAIPGAYSSYAGGCTRSFYVLVIVNMGKNNVYGPGNPYPSSPGWKCPTRDWLLGGNGWASEGTWVTGKFE